MDKEIEIPQGYKARIEGNKVILEPKESDDEKIREDMLEALTNCLDELIENNGWNYVYVNNKNIPINEVKKWLEKQQEQKPVPKFSIGDYVIDTNYKGEPLYQIVGIDKECYICEYRGDKEMGDRAVIHFTFDNPYLRLEQKPTPDWIPRFLDELRSKKNYFDWDEHRDIEGQILAIINWIAPNYFDRKGKEQKPIKVYDNMDDLIADAMIDEINKSDMRDNEKHNRIYWINKHRQNSTEWSEEDDAYRRLLIAILEFEHPNGIFSINASDVKIFKSDVVVVKRIIDWLKSLRPQPSWKPSEEQMKILRKYVMGEWRDLTIGQDKILTSLYNDLQKIK